MDRGRDHSGAAVVVPDDQPVRVRQARLRRPAAWALAVGAASLVPLSWAAFRPESERLLTWGTPASGTTIDLAGVLFFVAGCFACVWLVRLQWLLVRANRVATQATDFGIWVMWVIPVVAWVLPAIRISRWDKAVHGRRSWVVIAWAVSWIPFSAFTIGPSNSRTAVPATSEGWLHVGVFVTTFVLWAATVLRLTRGAEVVAHVSGADA